MAIQRNRAYVVITAVSNGTLGGTGLTASCTYTIVDPTNTVVVATSGGPGTQIDYGDSPEVIREAVAADLRITNSDPALEVIFC